LGSRRIPRVADRGHLPEALKLLRTRLDVNRIELGRRLGLSRQQLYGWEKGIAEPSFAALRKMLTGMGFDLHDLQDALDAVENRQPREWRLAPSSETAVQDMPFGETEKFLLMFLRFFAQLVAEELRNVVPVERR